jgi:hypothetical protein
MPQREIAVSTKKNAPENAKKMKKRLAFFFEKMLIVTAPTATV